MIITKLKGGLGNQMFQYALARQLAILNHTTAILDLDFLNDRPNECNYTLRSYELDIFNIKAKLTDRYFESGLLQKIKNKLNNLKYIHEPGIFNPKILKLKGTIYLNGFWQSESYFNSIDATIREDFSFKSKLSAENQSHLDRIRSCNAISLHVRRGDYVSNPIAATHHGICSIDYYLNAISELNKKTVDPEYFIFSDDINWVQANLPITAPHHFITNNKSTESYNDMRLMASCNHHIIANSSFSWWGAWLNPNAEKIVIAPKRWLNDETQPNLDIIPKEWIKL